MKTGILLRCILVCFAGSAIAQSNITTYTYFGSKARYSNPAGTLILKNGQQLGFGSSGFSTVSKYPEINTYITNNPSARGFFSYLSGGSPYSTNTSGSAFFNLTNFSFFVPPPTNNGAVTNSTNAVVSFVYQTGGVVNNSPFSNPDSIFAFGDNSANPAQPYPTGFRLPGSQVTNTIDLRDLFSPPNLGVSGPMRVRLTGPKFFDLELAEINVPGNSNFVESNAIFPDNIDLKRAVPSGPNIIVQFSALTTNFWVDPLDYTAQTNYQAVNAYVQSNLSRIHLDEYLGYDLSFLESDHAGRELRLTFANFYCASLARAVVAEPFPSTNLVFEYRRGGVGVQQSRASSFTTHGGSASSRSDVLSGNSLSAGVYADCAGEGEVGIARAVAYNTFRFTGAQTTQVVFRADLQGLYRPAPFNLPPGYYGAEAGAAVFDRAQFNSVLRGQPADYLLDTSFADILTGPFQPALLHSGNARLDQLSGSTNVTVGNPDSTGSRNITASLSSGAFTATPGGEYIILLDLYAFSQIQELGGTYGASSLYFYDSLKFAAAPFVNESGQTITNMVPAPEPALRIVSVLPGGTDELNLSWDAVNGRVYQVQASPDVAAADWSNVGEPVTATNNLAAATVSAPAAPQGRFYRVIGVQ